MEHQPRGDAAGASADRAASAAAGRVSVDVVERVGDLEPLIADWDRLVQATGRPLGAPAWLLAWWRHLSPPGARLRVLVCRRGGAVVGVVPLVAVRGRILWRYAPLGADSAGDAVVIAPGAEAQVGRAVASVIRRLRPRVAQFLLRPSPADRRHGFDRGLSRGRPSLQRVSRVDPVPAATMHPEGYDAWLAAKTRHFRKREGQRRRGLERAGGRVARVTGPDEAEEALAAYAALHEARWGDRSPLVGPAARAAIAEAAGQLVPAGRWRIWTVRDPAGRIVAVEIIAVAGDTFLSWTGGYDPEWGARSPSMVLLTAAIADAHASGARVFDFGEGGQDYKARLADHAGTMAEVRRFPLAPAGLAAAAGMMLRAAGRRMPAASGR